MVAETSCALLPHLIPRHCKMPNPQIVAIVIISLLVLPIAAAMPNHMPRTWSRRPRPTACVELTVEEVSDDSDNVRSRGMPETQPSYRGEAKMQAGSGEEF